jgi:prepilin-type N-terminal cleavage/methylation domain-containing protein
MSRRGFTLVEILVGLILTGIVGTAIIRALTGTQRGTSSQFARIDAQETARAVNYYLTAALREVNASDGDIEVADASTLKFRGMRWTGISCTGVTVTGGSLRITVKNTQLFGQRAPDALLDSLFVFNENNPGVRTDDAWLLGIVTNTGNNTCTDGSAGTRLTLVIAAASGGNAAAVAGFTSGSPIRGWQPEEISLPAVSGVYWLGQRTMDNSGAWTAVTQLAGPLTSTGLALTYYDNTNTVTATLANIASVGLIVRSRSVDIARGSAGTNTNIQDSLVTRIAIRNNNRY